MKDKLPSTSITKDLLIALLKTRPIVIDEVFRGDSITYSVSCEKGDFILRTSGMRSNYDLEHAVLRLARKKGIKVPKPIAASTDLSRYPFTFSLQEKIFGKNLYKISERLRPTILEEVGSQLKLLNSIRLGRFGLLSIAKFRKTGRIVGSYGSWKAFLVRPLRKRITEVREKIEKEDFKGTKLSKKRQADILKVLSKTDRVWQKVEDTDLNIGEGKLIHHDIHFGHILVNKGKLSGIIDFNHASVGDPLFDIAYFSVMPRGELYKFLLKESDINFNKERFNLYRLLISVRKIHTRLVRYNYLNEYPKVIDIALKELER